MKMKRSIVHMISHLAAVLCLVIAVSFISTDVHARAIGPAEDICTDGPQFNPPMPAGGGPVTALTSFVQGIISGASEQLFNKISGDGQFTGAVQAMITLYVGLYGVFFAFGMTRATAHNVFRLLIKLGLVSILAQGGAWSFFNTHVVPFFDGILGTYMGMLANMAIGGTGGNPINIIDQTLLKVLSANMLVHIIATLFTGYYGVFHTILLVIGLWSVIGTLLTGIWVLLTSTLLRAFLIGVAPLFLACILFKRTQRFFIGWLNQVINTILQPIMLFTFFTFFVLILYNPNNNNGLISKVLDYPVCWTGTKDFVRGTPFYVDVWRYTVKPSANSSDTELYSGAWGLDGPEDIQGANQPVFPIDTMALLLFFMIAELGGRFNQVVLMLAQNLSASSINLSSVNVPFSDLVPSIGTPVSSSGGPAAAAADSPAARAAKADGGGGGTVSRKTGGGVVDPGGGASGRADDAQSNNGRAPGQKKPVLNVRDRFRGELVDRLAALSRRK